MFAVDNATEKSIITLREGRALVSFEQAFDDTEQAAKSAQESARKLTSHIRALEKAARSGNIAAIERARHGLDAALNELREKAAGASSAWPFGDEDERQYLSDRYADELCHAAEEAGLKIYERDGNLISYPSIVRILPGERAVRIDRKKEANIRPSHLAGVLLKNQQKSSAYRPNSFLEALYTVYSEIVSEGSSGRMVSGDGRVVALARIYRLITALPGLSREYGRGDFARDLYELDSKGPHHTRKGARVSFPSSTGTRGRSSDLFAFIGPDGQSVEYYGLRFTEGG